MTRPTSFQTVLEALQEPRQDFPRAYLHHFSDIDPQSLEALMGVWPRLQPARKLLLLDGLVSLLDSDTLVSFEDLGRAFLDDAQPEVRTRAIRLLAECDDPKLVHAFIEILKNDPDLAPRLEAANRLGEFVLLGELDELPGDLHHQAEDALLAAAGSEEHASLRRLSLEAVSFSSRAEVETLIHSAINRSEPAWVASALVAMGRSNDEQYGEQVVDMLVDPDPRIRLAAVRAAGELGLEAARPILINMLLDGEEDDDAVIAAAIWSLSQIGGEDVRAFLVEMLDRTEDEDLSGYLEEALENLDFTEELESFDLMSLEQDLDQAEPADDEPLDEGRG
jgi:HEAT repeat protein